MSRQARAKKRVGRNKIRFSNYGRDAIGLRLSNEARLDLARSGTKDLLEGTMEANRARMKAAQTTDSNN